MITGVLLVIIQKFDRVLFSNQTFMKVIIDKIIEFTYDNDTNIQEIAVKTFEILCIKCYKSIAMNNLIALETLNTIK